MTHKGWTLPQTNSGKSALVCAPPWHYSGDVIGVEFQAGIDAAQALLPPGFETQDGRGIFVFADWASSADADSRLIEDPVLGQYKEALCILFASYKGESVTRVPFIWVDNDISLVRGLIQGFPKKSGEIYMTRPVNIGKGGVRRAAGSRFSAHVSSRGHRLVTARVDVTSKGSEDFPPYMVPPMIHTRLWPSIEGDEPAVCEYQRARIVDPASGLVFTGSATLEFGVSEYDEISALGPIEVGQGYTHEFAFTVAGGEVWPVSQ